MKLMIQFAVVVVLAFGGMVVLRETGRRQEAPQRLAADVTVSKQRIATISTGGTVEIRDHLDPSKWTVVEFAADW